MSVGKASIKRAASAETKKTSAAKKTGNTAKNVKSSVLTPMNSEELQVVFLKEKASADGGKTNRPIRITEELPDYLL